MNKIYPEIPAVSGHNPVYEMFFQLAPNTLCLLQFFYVRELLKV